MSCLFRTQRFFFCLFSANYKLGTLPRQQTPQNDCKYAANVTKMVCYLHLAASIASLRINFKLVAIMCGICSTELFKRHGTLLKKLKSRQKKKKWNNVYTMSSLQTCFLRFRWFNLSQLLKHALELNVCSCTLMFNSYTTCI